MDCLRLIKKKRKVPVDKMLESINEIFNSPLIGDPTASFIATSAARAVLIGFFALAILRLSQAVRMAPLAHFSLQGWVEFLNTPWWKAPTLGVIFGFSICMIVVGIQLFAPASDPDSHITLLQAATYTSLSIVLWSTAVGASKFRRRVAEKDKELT